MKENNRYIIFDFDGTLADTLDLAVNLFNGIAHEFDLKPLLAEDRELLRKKRPQELLRNFGVSKMKLATLLLRLRKEMAHTIPDMKMITGMKDELTKLKGTGYRLGVLTSNSVENVAAFLSANELTAVFNFIYSGKNLFGKKTVINNMLIREGISKTQAIYVGDETRDVEASQKAGIPVIAVSWGLNERALLEELKPDRIADRPEELSIFVKQIFNTASTI